MRRTIDIYPDPESDRDDWHEAPDTRGDADVKWSLLTSPILIGGALHRAWVSDGWGRIGFALAAVALVFHMVSAVVIHDWGAERADQKAEGGRDR